MSDFFKEYFIKINEIKRLYPSLKKYGDVWVMGSYNNIYEQQILKEFITKTISQSKTVDELFKRFDIDLIEENGANIICSFKKEQFKYINELNKFMESFGWYPAIFESGEKYSEENLDMVVSTKEKTYIIYEPKFDVQVDIKEDYLYHLVPDVLYKRVMMSGLTPKNKEKIAAHPERVYLLNPTSDYEEISLSLWDKWSEQTKNIIEYYYLLQIDAQKLIEERGVKFYKDPNFYVGNGAVWCFENIPPLYIKEIEKILVNPK